MCNDRPEQHAYDAWLVKLATEVREEEDDPIMGRFSYSPRELVRKESCCVAPASMAEMFAYSFGESMGMLYGL